MRIQAGWNFRKGQVVGRDTRAGCLPLERGSDWANVIAQHDRKTGHAFANNAVRGRAIESCVPLERPGKKPELRGPGFSTHTSPPSSQLKRFPILKRLDSLLSPNE